MLKKKKYYFSGINKTEFNQRHKLLIIDNFLDENLYDDLIKNFPNFSALEKINKNNFTLNSGNEDTNENQLFNEKMNLNPIWKDFINDLNSNDFFNELKRIYKLKFLYFDKEKNNFKRYFRFKFLTRTFNLFNKVHFEFTFNCKSAGDGKPHTDVPKKIISIVLFMLDINWVNEFGGSVLILKPKKLSNENNWDNRSIDFDECYILKKIDYIKNRLYAFKKSKNSYHAITNVKVNNDSFRRVFMINLCYSNQEDISFRNFSFINKIKNFFLKKNQSLNSNE